MTTIKNLNVESINTALTEIQNYFDNTEIKKFIAKNKSIVESLIAALNFISLKYDEETTKLTWTDNKGSTSSWYLLGTIYNLTIDKDEVVLVNCNNKEEVHITVPYSVKATNDADGNNIANTYSTKKENDTLETALKKLINDGLADELKRAQQAESDLNTKIDNGLKDINDKIPTEASSTNQLADKNYVDTAVTQNTAFFRGTFTSEEKLKEYTGDLTNNDYAFVSSTTEDFKVLYARYKYVASTKKWAFEYYLDNEAYTDTQWKAINSNITSELTTKLEGIEAGAEVNVQADWTETTDTSDAYIKNKPNVDATTYAASKTISEWSEKDGVVDIKLQDIDITHSQINDWPDFKNVATSGDYYDLSTAPGNFKVESDANVCIPSHEVYGQQWFYCASGSSNSPNSSYAYFIYCVRNGAFLTQTAYTKRTDETKSSQIYERIGVQKGTEWSFGKWLGYDCSTYKFDSTSGSKRYYRVDFNTSGGLILNCNQGGYYIFGYNTKPICIGITDNCVNGYKWDISDSVPKLYLCISSYRAFEFKLDGLSTTISRISSIDSSIKLDTEFENVIYQSTLDAIGVSNVGGDGKYISAVAQSNAFIIPTVTTADTQPIKDSLKMITSGGVYSAIQDTVDNLDVDATNGTGYISSISETDGKVSATYTDWPTFNQDTTGNAATSDKLAYKAKYGMTSTVTYLKVSGMMNTSSDNVFMIQSRAGELLFVAVGHGDNSTTAKPTVTRTNNTYSKVAGMTYSGSDIYIKMLQYSHPLYITQIAGSSNSTITITVSTADLYNAGTAITIRDLITSSEAPVLGVKGNSEDTYRVGNVNITKENIGLGNVVNTGDSATPTSGGTDKFTTGGAYTELAKKLDKNGLSTNSYNKNDNGGYYTWLLMYDVTSDWAVTSGGNKRGFIGQIVCDRGGTGANHVSAIMDISCAIAYNGTNGKVFTYSSRFGNAVNALPCCLKYTDTDGNIKYYLALQLRGGSYKGYMLGKFWGTWLGTQINGVDASDATKAGNNLPSGYEAAASWSHGGYVVQSDYASYSNYSRYINPSLTTKSLATVTTGTTTYIKLATCTWSQSPGLYVYVTGTNFSDTLYIMANGGNSIKVNVCGWSSSNSTNVKSVRVVRGSAYNSNYEIWLELYKVGATTVSVSRILGACTINTTDAFSETTTAPSTVSYKIAGRGFFGDFIGNADITKTTDTTNGDKLQIGNGTAINITNSAHAAKADDATNDSDGNKITDTYLPLSAGSDHPLEGVLYSKQSGNNPRAQYGSSITLFDSNSNTTSDYNFGLYQWDDSFQFTYRTSTDNKFKGLAFDINGSNGKVDFKNVPTVNGSTTWGIDISGNASTATNATNDSDGNAINTTYLKKDGSNATNTGVSADLAVLTSATANITDSTSMITSNANGYSSTNNLFYKRPATSFWNYIEDKISSILGLTATSYSGKASTAGTADKATNADITKTTSTINGDTLQIGNGTSATITNSVNATRLTNEAIVIQTSDTKMSRISLSTLITWLITTKGYIPSNTSCTKTIHTTWSYANNDILQLTIGSNNYELQLAGVIIEFFGSASNYNTGVFRLRIHSAPAISGFTVSDGYTKFPINHIAEYICNGSSYSPIWKMIATYDDITSLIGTLDLSSVGSDGKYIKTVSETNGKVSATEQSFDTSIDSTSTDSNAPTSKAVNTLITNTIESLDLDSIGSDGNYIKTVSETNGKVSATKQLFDTSIGSTSTDSNAPTSKAVYTAIQSLGNVYHICESVESKDKLPTTGNTAGDVRNVNDTGDNYVWNGNNWDALGGSTLIDAMNVSSPSASGNATSFITSVSQSKGIISASKATIPNASTSNAGIVKLNDTVTSTSTEQAATANSVKSVQDSITTHKNNTSNPHNVTATQIGLGNVTNVATESTITKGSDKNITSGAVYSGLDSKIDKADGVTNIGYDSVNKKFTETVNGTTSDIISTTTLKSDMLLDNVTNNAQIKGLADGTTENHIVIFGTDGYTVKDSGHTIGKDVPSNAVFTDRYVSTAEFTDNSSTNANSPVKMTLTRAGSDTESIVGNIPKVSNSSAGVAPKGNTVSTQSQTTKFLREDGKWATPSYTTNTWRGIQDNLTSSSNSTDSLSAKQGYNLANGSAKDNNAVASISGDGTSTTIVYTKRDGTTASFTTKDTSYESLDAVKNGTDVSLVTTNEKYNWNNKTSNTGTVTSIAVKMNNSQVGSAITDSGTIDLGTVITSETQLSKGATTGAGNAVSDISVSNHKITLIKGSSFLTSNDIAGKADAVNTTTGTYKSVTVNSQGLVTSGSNPTTLSGYGITDAYISDGTVYLGSKSIKPIITAPVISVNGKTGSVSLEYTDVGALPNTTTHLSGDVPTTRTINGKTLSSDIELNATDVNALASTAPAVNIIAGGTEGQVLTSNGADTAPSWKNLAISPNRTTYSNITAGIGICELITNPSTSVGFDLKITDSSGKVITAYLMFMPQVVSDISCKVVGYCYGNTSLNFSLVINSSNNKLWLYSNNSTSDIVSIELGILWGSITVPSSITISGGVSTDTETMISSATIYDLTNTNGFLGDTFIQTYSPTLLSNGNVWVTDVENTN